MARQQHNVCRYALESNRDSNRTVGASCTVNIILSAGLPRTTERGCELFDPIKHDKAAVQ